MTQYTEDPSNFTLKAPTAYRTIGEVANELDVPQHVLRFWEEKFPVIRPVKRGGGRRYYRLQDVDAIKKIKYLLYDKGFTIKGAQQAFKETPSLDDDAQDFLPQVSAANLSSAKQSKLRDIISELQEIRECLG